MFFTFFHQPTKKITDVYINEKKCQTHWRLLMFSGGKKLCNPHIECVFYGSSLSVLEMHIKCLQRKTLKSNSQLSNSVRARIKALYLHKVNFSLVGLLAYRSECVKRSHTVILLAALRYIWKSNLKMICCLFFLQWCYLGLYFEFSQTFSCSPFFFSCVTLFSTIIYYKSLLLRNLCISSADS